MTNVACICVCEGGWGGSGRGAPGLSVPFTLCTNLLTNEHGGILPDGNLGVIKKFLKQA